MAKPDDTSGEHFDWLVAGRSQNQRATLQLYKLIEDHEARLDEDLTSQDCVEQLIGIAFSLWRAVFLTDLTGEAADQLADGKQYLRALIAHNTVLYQTDFTAREWSFRYYLDNAVHRILTLPDAVRPETEFPGASGSAKDQWTRAQAALDVAIGNFAQRLSAHGQA